MGTAYRVDSDNILLGGQINATFVDIYECDPQLQPFGFRLQFTVGPNKKYDALEIFGSVVRGPELKKLADILSESGITVNRYGYIYLRVEGSVRTTLGKNFYRLNDLLDWSDFGVKPPLTMVWNRCGLPNGNVIISYEEQKKCLEKLQNDLHEREKEMNDLENQLSNSKKQLQRKEEESKDASNKLSVTESFLKSTNNELQLSKAQVVAVQKELEDCKKQLQAKDGKLKKARGELSNCEEKLRGQDEQLGGLRIKFAVAEAELKSTRNELQSSKEAVAALQNELNSNKELLAKLLFVGIVVSFLFSLFLKKMT